jgi:hypothetical protein
MPTEQQIDNLVDATWQLLDDMGKDGLSVCAAAKAKARVAIEPFKYIDNEFEMTLDDAIAILKRCET